MLIYTWMDEWMGGWMISFTLTPGYTSDVQATTTILAALIPVFNTSLTAELLCLA